MARPSHLQRLGTGFNLAIEQFWGRAARASRTRKSLGTLVIFGARDRDLRTTSVGRDGEIDRNLGLRFYRLGSLVVRPEVPLPDCILRRTGQNGRSAEHP